MLWRSDHPSPSLSLHLMALTSELTDFLLQVNPAVAPFPPQSEVSSIPIPSPCVPNGGPIPFSTHGLEKRSHPFMFGGVDPSQLWKKGMADSVVEGNTVSSYPISLSEHPVRAKRHQALYGSTKDGCGMTQQLGFRMGGLCQVSPVLTSSLLFFSVCQI